MDDIERVKHYLTPEEFEKSIDDKIALLQKRVDVIDFNQRGHLFNTGYKPMLRGRLFIDSKGEIQGTIWRNVGTREERSQEYKVEDYEGGVFNLAIEAYKYLYSDLDLWDERITDRITHQPSTYDNMIDDPRFL